MSNSRFWVMASSLFVLGVFGFAFSIVGFDVGFTGFTVFGDFDAGDFDLGVYSNTEWNGSAIVLSGSSLSGSYVSRVFDSGSKSIWNNISWVAGEFGDLPDNSQGSLMSGNVLLMHMEESSENIMDESGNGNDGNYNGELYSEVGRIGDGIGLDGINDKINTSLNLANLNKVTVSAWFYRDSNFYRFDISESENNNHDRIKLIRHNNGMVYAVVQVGSSNSYATFTDDSVGWRHIAFTYDGTGVSNADKLKMYLNGVEQSLTFTGTIPSQLPSFTNNLNIGYDLGSSTYSKGSIDEVAIWDRSLSPEEIANVYSRGASSLNLSVRSCNNSLCLDKEFVDVSDISPIPFSLEDNEYFQYKFDFERDGTAFNIPIESVVVDYDFINLAPLLTIIHPENRLYVSNESVSLDFIVDDVDGNLEECWYSIDNGSNVGIPGCNNITFDVSGNGIYSLIVYANDSLGSESFDNVEFSIDSTGVVVILNNPLGIKTSRVNIPVSYSEVGAENCWYNVETSIGGNIIGNTSLANCSDATFNVASDGDYVLNLFANNSFGSFDMDNSSFSVDSSVIVPSVDNGGSSGGGGGGSSGAVSVSGVFEIEPINVIASIGEEKSLMVSVKNKGRVAANKCSLVGGDYIDSDSIFNIGIGEIVEFMFVLSVSDFGVEDFNLSVVCLDNVSEVVPLNVVILSPNLDVSIEGISLEDDGLLIAYSVDSAYDGEDVLIFRVFNSDGSVVVEVNEAVDLVYGEVYEGEVLIDISEVAKGMLKIAISDEDGVSFVEEDFVYGGGAGITGNALLDLEGNDGFVWIVGVLFVSLIGFVGWRSRKLLGKK